MFHASGADNPVSHSFLEELIRTVRNDPAILAVYQYGSSLTSIACRDIDICIISQFHNSDDIIPVFFQYSGTFAGYGDIPLDLTLFSLLPLYIRIEVIRTGKILYVRERDALFDLTRTLNREWDDYEPSYRILVS